MTTSSSLKNVLSSCIIKQVEIWNICCCTTKASLRQINRAIYVGCGILRRSRNYVQYHSYLNSYYVNTCTTKALGEHLLQKMKSECNSEWRFPLVLIVCLQSVENWQSMRITYLSNNIVYQHLKKLLSTCNVSLLIFFWNPHRPQP